MDLEESYIFSHAKMISLGDLDTIPWQYFFFSGCFRTIEEVSPAILDLRVRTNSHVCIFGVKDMGSVSLEESI